MGLKLNSASGSITLEAQDAAGDIVVSIPSSTGSVLMSDGDGSNLSGINTDLVGDTTPQLGGNLDMNAKTIAGVDATEMAILDGATLTTAELNILDGVTSTAAELNILNGVTATTAELNYVDGVTSSIQTQFNNLTDELGFSNVSAWEDSGVESVSLSKSAAGIGKAQVKVWEEIPATNKTNADWGVTTGDTGFDLIDSAYAQTITPSATTGSSVAFTMGGGTFASTDIGKRIINVSSSEVGEARIISIASNVATCLITTGFTNTDAIIAGDWEMYSGEFVNGEFSISNATVTSDPTGGTKASAGAYSDYSNTAALSATMGISVFILSGALYSRVTSVSGTTATVGAQATVYNATAVDYKNPRVTRLTDTTALASFATTLGVWAVVLSVSGTTVTAGTALNYYPGTAVPTNGGLDSLTSSTAFSTWQGSTINKAFGAHLTVSGMTVTAGTPAVVYDNHSTLPNRFVTLTPTSGVALFKRDSDKAWCGAVVSISGTTFTVGAITLFFLGEIAAGSEMNNFTKIAAVSSNQIVGLLHRKNNITYVVSATISGTTITIGTEAVVASGVATTKETLGLCPIDSTSFMVKVMTTAGTYANDAVVYVGTLSGTSISLSGAHLTSPINSTAMEDSGDIVKLSETSFLSVYRVSGTFSSQVVYTELPLYVSNEYVTTISGTDSVNTTYYSDWNSNTITETLNGGTANYAFSVNTTPSAATVTGGTFSVVGSGETVVRNIASSLNSVHGGTEGVWYTNTNTTYASNTWAASATNEAKAAIEIATAVTANQMSGTAFAAISDANLPAFGTQLSVAITLYTTDTSIGPTVDGISFNYDANVINRDETDNYIIEMPSVDTIQVTAPASGGPRNARIYITS